MEIEWRPVYPTANSVTFNTQLATIQNDIQIEVGEIETTGKPVSIEEVISHIEEALND